jgi:transposase
MALALSADLRCRVVAAVEDGMSCRAAAARFEIAPSTAIKWLQRWRRTGSVQPQSRGGDKRSHRLEAYAAAILALIDETPDITLAEIVAHLEPNIRDRSSPVSLKVYDHEPNRSERTSGRRQRSG